MPEVEGTEPKWVIVVGHGMVGHRFCERLGERDSDRGFRVVAFGEEPRPAYDRVHLSDFFGGRSARELALTNEWRYAERGYSLHLRERVLEIDRAQRQITTDRGLRLRYDALVLATGSVPLVPPVPGIQKRGVFVYRTIEDLEDIRSWAGRTSRAAVLGGGLLGLEAAKAAVDMGLETHVVELAPRLMPRQLDDAGSSVLRRSVEELGVHVRLGARTEEVLGDRQVEALRFSDGSRLEVDMVIVSAGIKPRDDLARHAGLAIGDRGGVCVDDTLVTSDPHIFAIGECALHQDTIYGLVGPGYEMAEVLVDRLNGGSSTFHGGDLSAQLKLLGVDVASFGAPFEEEDGSGSARTLVVEDRIRGTYQKLRFSADGSRLIGGILVGDAERYVPLVSAMKQGAQIPEQPHELLFGSSSGAGNDVLADTTQVCSCNNVTAGEIRAAIAEHDLTTLGGVKACTKAGTGCSGCLTLVGRILDAEVAKAGREVKRNVCEHFEFTREELLQIVKLGKIQSFEALLTSHGQGQGCEICRPVVGSILASTWNEMILEHPQIQDTNDRFLANIQRGGTYSVIPRVPGGEITPEKLIVLGRVAQKYDLYCKITGGQRIDLLGARVDQLPDIWEELVDAGFESGHAYGKAMRTVKSCIGSTWCRYGVQDSTGFAIRVEERYRGIRAPHKLKSAVSGCIRECAEAQGKDFGLIATEKGWNLYLCGNGGAEPRHADLVAKDLDDDTALRYIDRFLMYYIQTAKPLERTARWIERMDGGIEYLKAVILEDSLGICSELEKSMQALVDTYACEWAAVVKDPERRKLFRHFAQSEEADPSIEFVRERGQKRPPDWPNPEPLRSEPSGAPLDTEIRPTPEGIDASDTSWVVVGPTSDFRADTGSTVRHGSTQIAVFNFASRGEWYATEAMCPHRKDMVLARGLLGSEGGIPKVACPLHKKTFSLETGDGLNDPAFKVRTFPVRIRDGMVEVALPPDSLLSRFPSCGLHGSREAGSDANAAL